MCGAPTTAGRRARASRVGRVGPIPRPLASPEPWTPEERAWALECLEAGDSVAEVASWAGRRPADVRAALDLDRGREIGLQLRAFAQLRFDVDPC